MFAHEIFISGIPERQEKFIESLKQIEGHIGSRGILGKGPFLKIYKTGSVNRLPDYSFAPKIRLSVDTERGVETALALASQRTGDIQKGEWVTVDEDSLYKFYLKGELYQVRNPDKTGGLEVEANSKGNTDTYFKKSFIRATAEEIIQHFNKKYNMLAISPTDINYSPDSVISAPPKVRKIEGYRLKAKFYGLSDTIRQAMNDKWGRDFFIADGSEAVGRVRGLGTLDLWFDIAYEEDKPLYKVGDFALQDGWLYKIAKVDDKCIFYIGLDKRILTLCFLPNTQDIEFFNLEQVVRWFNLQIDGYPLQSDGKSIAFGCQEFIEDELRAYLKLAKITDNSLKVRNVVIPCRTLSNLLTLTLKLSENETK